VRDENTQAVFGLFGEQVKKLAFETYGLLTSIVSISIILFPSFVSLVLLETFSLYPNLFSYILYLLKG
jgi:hypothetical protein